MSSLHRFSDVNVVFTRSISLIDLAPSALISLPVIQHSYFILFFFLSFSSQLISSDVNVAFTWSISLIDLAPSTSISFPVTRPLLHSPLFFQHPLHPRLSDVKVVFTSSISPIAFAPSSSISFSVIKPCFFPFLLPPPLLPHHTDSVKLMSCSLSIHRIISLSPHLQYAHLFTNLLSFLSLLSSISSPLIFRVVNIV